MRTFVTLVFIFLIAIKLASCARVEACALVARVGACASDRCKVQLNDGTFAEADADVTVGESICRPTL